ncbi:hypothetical protein M942_04690 [Enterobacter ludwigii]|uniref:hypothetical protein n=1 Tax=Enterobacter ludwigii TaxID=299767 RepID=UPI0003D95F73|nr:hypothetical protein [Enterobacter ludwigii]AHE72584.1 hypothetical protein M942_04690 [Enterobacter ludwigii]
MRKEPLSVLQEAAKEPVIERIFQLVERYPSRSAAARAWDININTLKNYYRRQGLTPIPRQHQLAKIAEVENVSMEWLLHGVGPSHEKPKGTTKEPKNTTNQKLLDLFSVLSEEEKQAIIEVLTRKGVETILYLLDKDSVKLLQLPDSVKAGVLRLANRSDTAIREILSKVERDDPPESVADKKAV